MTPTNPRLTICSHLPFSIARDLFASNKIIGGAPFPDVRDLHGPLTSLELRSAAALIAEAKETDPCKALMLVLLHFIKDPSVPRELQPVLASADAYWLSGKGTPDTLETAKENAGSI